MNIGRKSKYVILLAALMIAIPTAVAPCCPPAAIGDYVWNDLDRDGIQDAGEPGIAGVTVELYDCEGTPTLLASMVTDGNGLYEFTGLTPGSYCVKFIRPDGMVFTAWDAGADDTVDSDADPTTGMTVCTTLECDETDLTWDAGMYESDTPSPGTGTPGYWKNHPEAWPVEEITIGGVTHSKVVAIYIMGMPEKGDKRCTMFRALVAAKLNVFSNNDDSCIAEAIADADLWMASNELSRVRGSSDAWKIGEPLYWRLDAYNNGELCAPSRDSQDQ